ncbi:tRNA glutamyl-Q(34) synthetase GluQRS [Microvirga yunnanensis]|uniref:tRNA glutamyl-Q(34) synthetase GluQRS n=1 Tax=Microvirga yunnanensis TaxID=2953740 RepID=UPI0021C7EC41|nr:tRNA glutamyl-Q(34) synthetase GluQRS [Microvirga sp. HBU65207]
MTKPVFRFAPSPNGRLHLGHAYSALLNADFAGRFGGRFLLRIEDIDITRCRPDFEAAIHEDLAWLGLQWEIPVRRQSEHFADYRAAFLKLKGRGVVYPCFCTRRDIVQAVARREQESGRDWPRDPDGAPLYPGTCREVPAAEAERRIAAGEPQAWRLDSAAAQKLRPGPHAFRRFDRDGREETVAADPWRWGDAVIVRKEIPSSYHLSVVVDDALQGVTHVVRGQDLEAATDLHVLLQALLDLPTPLYHHHGLVLDPTGDKLAKSRQSPALSELRADGVTPQAIRRRLGF